MLAFLPIIGPLLSGVAHIFESYNATKMAKDKNDLEEVRLRLTAQRKDIRFQIQQDMIVFPVALYTLLYMEGKIMTLMYPDLVWSVAAIDYAPMTILPAVVLGYLFGLAIRNRY